MKTIRDYLEMLNEPERSEAIENTPENRLKSIQFNSTEDSLIIAFDWESSIQGHDYWNDIHNKLCYNTYKFENENDN